jgi:hypothetical protein
LQENQLPPGTTINSLAAGSTHLLIILSDGSVQVVGENQDSMICQGPQAHPEKAFPPVFVRLLSGERFKVSLVWTLGVASILMEAIIKKVCAPQHRLSGR